jgi:hypothetical protein
MMCSSLLGFNTPPLAAKISTKVLSDTPTLAGCPAIPGYF